MLLNGRGGADAREEVVLHEHEEQFSSIGLQCASPEEPYLVRLAQAARAATLVRRDAPAQCRLIRAVRLAIE
jgi:hypothetical protein